MIGYLTIGTNDFERAAEFYDTLLGAAGGKRFMESERLIAWSAGNDSPSIGVRLPYDGRPATVGNGMMIPIAVDSAEKVQAPYDTALDLNGSDEGAPSLPGGEFFAACFRDPEGNKLNAFCMRS